MGENNKKTLIVYYSRTGNSEIIAKDLQNKLGCDTDKIEYANKKRVSFLGALFEAFGKKTKAITGAEHNPGDYEKIIFITPVWAGAMSTPIRSYMAKHKANIKSYSLIAALTKDGFEYTIKDAVQIMQAEPTVSEQYLDSQIKSGEYDLGKFLG